MKVKHISELSSLTILILDYLSLTVCFPGWNILFYLRVVFPRTMPCGFILEFPFILVKNGKCFLSQSPTVNNCVSSALFGAKCVISDSRVSNHSLIIPWRYIILKNEVCYKLLQCIFHFR